VRKADSSQARMDILEQRAFLQLSAWDLRGAVSDLRKVAEDARLAGDSDRQGRALLETGHALMILGHRQTLAAIEEGEAALSSAPDPIVAAMIDLCRHFAGMYLFGWNQERAAAFESALPRVTAIEDPRTRSRITMMEAAVLCLTGEYSSACEKAEQAR